MKILYSLISICFFIAAASIPTLPIYLIFFFIRSSKARKLAPDASPSLVTLGLYFLVAFISLSMVIPHYYKFASKARTVEAKTNLIALAEAQLAYFDEYGSFAGITESDKVFDIIGWSPDGGTYYAYYCGDDFIPPSLSHAFEPESASDWSYPVRPETSATDFSCMAVGNIDAEGEFLDVWMINKDKTPIHLYDDVNDIVLYGHSDFENWFDRWGFGPIILIIAAPLLIVRLFLDGRRYRAGLAVARSWSGK